MITCCCFFISGKGYARTCTCTFLQTPAGLPIWLTSTPMMRLYRSVIVIVLAAIILLTIGVYRVGLQSFSSESYHAVVLPHSLLNQSYTRLGTNAISYEHEPGLVWTSLKNGSDKDTNFFSAHFDRRREVPHRPAVLVFGYHMKSLKEIKLYCRFTYATETICQTEPVQQIRSCSSGLDGDKIANSYTYLCGVKCKSAECSEEEIPVSVAISKHSDCTSASADIPVLNRQPPKESEKKMFGVCLQSPVYGENGLQQIIEYIEMNQALGADIVNLYVMDMDKLVWNFLHTHYVKKGLIHLLKWKKVEKWVPLHYFGQSLIMHDCLYRNMYKVKYLAVVDLDEVILPLQHRNWPELFNSISGLADHHSFRFGNCFYVKNEGDKPSNSNVPCDKVHMPKYFERTSRRNCFCSDQYIYRPKYMVQTELIIDMFVHWVCQAIKGDEYKVPRRVAVNAHYRETLPNDCNDKASTHDQTALQYQSAVLRAMGEHMCLKQG